jgi:hypothetical protein
MPTRFSQPTIFIRRTSERHFAQFGLRTILVSTGGDDSGKPLLSESLFVIPLTSSLQLIEIASREVPAASEIVFGRHIQNLGFGGSSNLTQLIGILLRFEQWIKLDDDCGITKFDPTVQPVAGAVGVGRYDESVPHPKELLLHVSPDISDRTRLDLTGTPLAVQSLKNGALLMSRGAAMLAPYPVLYSSRLDLSLRGEVYDWARRVSKLGGRFVLYHNLSVQHFRRHWDMDEWITQMLLKADSVFLDADSDVGGSLRPSERHRIENLNASLRATRRNSSILRPTARWEEIEREAMVLSTQRIAEEHAATSFWQELVVTSDQLINNWRRQSPDVASSLLNWI